MACVARYFRDRTLGLHRLRYRQGPHEISKVIGQHTELETHGVGGEGPTSQPGPFDRALALFNPLLSRAALVVEGDDSLGPPRQVAHDEADARVKLAPMPSDLGHDAARLGLAPRLITETGKVAAHLVRRSSDRRLEQVFDPALQDAVSRQPDRVADALGFEKLISRGWRRLRRRENTGASPCLGSVRSLVPAPRTTNCGW